MSRANPQPTLPPMPNLTSVDTADGLKLHVREWPCAGAHGSVLIVHGLGEHIGRYEHVAAQLLRGGRHVVGYDQRGHGASEGARGRLNHPDDLLRDLALVIDAVRARRPGPLVLLGHSMGGLVAARLTAGALESPRPAWSREVDALVLSSPALDAGMSGVQKLLLSVLGPLAPNLGLGNGLKPDWISRDPAVVKAYIDDPLVHDRVTPKLVRFIVDGGEFVRAHAAQWQLPTLLLYAGSDRCVAPAGSAAFAAAAPTDRVTTQAFPPLFHEIFNEPEQAEVFAVLAAWLGPALCRPGI
jgi:alpha-beta hydrolase superfamily lysophospholipase